MRTCERIFAIGLAVATVGAMVSPLVADPVVDGFPLSNYPMFSVARDTTAVRLAHVIAFDAGGHGRPVAPSILGSVEVMQAQQTVWAAVRRGSPATQALCERAAAAVANAGAAWVDAVHLQVRIDTYDAIAYFEGDTAPNETEVLARCSVERGQ